MLDVAFVITLLPLLVALIASLGTAAAQLGGSSQVRCTRGGNNTSYVDYLV
jgi:hypothetical protein